MDTAMRVYQTLGRNILGLTAVSTVFCLASFAYVLYYALPSLGETSNASNINVQVGEAMLTMLLTVCIGGPLFVMGVSYTSAIIVQLVSDYMLGNVPNVNSVKEGARRLWPRMFGVVLFETLLCAGGLLIAGGFMMLSALIANTAEEGNVAAAGVSWLASMALIIGFICFPIIAGRHALTIPIAVIEGVSPWKAMKRSTQLLKGNAYVLTGYNTIIAVFALILILLVILSIGYAGIMGLLPQGDIILKAEIGSTLGAILTKAIELAPLYLALWTIIPVWCTTATVLYYERRIRWEGFDIEALAQDVWRTDRRSRFEL